jgi:hypothetical protein
MRIAYVQLQQEIESLKMEALQKKLDELEGIATKTKANAPNIHIYKSFFVPPKSVLSKSPVVIEKSALLPVSTSSIFSLFIADDML